MKDFSEALAKMANLLDISLKVIALKLAELTQATEEMQIKIQLLGRAASEIKLREPAVAREGEKTVNLKVVCLGFSAVGKSWLLHRISKPSYADVMPMVQFFTCRFQADLMAARH